MVEGVGFEPTKLSQRIYSPPQLATLVPLHDNADRPGIRVAHPNPLCVRSASPTVSRWCSPSELRPHAKSDPHRRDTLTTEGESKQALQDKASTDSYPSAPRVAALPRRTDPPCGLQGVFPLSSGTCHLEVGFALRCFQRFSRPDVATQRCTRRHNWNTSGRFIPVLSYWGRPLSHLLRPRQIGTELSHDVLNPARVPL